MTNFPPGPRRQRLVVSGRALREMTRALYVAAVPADVQKRVNGFRSDKKQRIRKSRNFSVEKLAIRCRALRKSVNDSLAILDDELAENELRNAIVELADIFLMRGEDDRLDNQDKGAAVWAADCLIEGMTTPPTFKKRLQKLKSEHLQSGLPSNAASMGVAIGSSKAVFVGAHRRARQIIHHLGIDELLVLTGGSTTGITVAEHLLRSAEFQKTTGEEESHFDRSDAKVKLLAVEVEGFRGLPDVHTLNLSKEGAPTSVIILGDNGTGKSSYVDAIEFALQGRVGRSDDFDSSLGPALQSFTRQRDGEGVGSSTVVLSDQSVQTRVAQSDATGRLRAVGPSIRPGFQLAPIVLRRADILRFLDTDALSRGTVFFDYFHGTAEGMALRPDQTHASSLEERHQLRIRRRSLTLMLSRLLNVPADDLAKADKFTEVVRSRLLGNKSAATAVAEGNWIDVDNEVKTVVLELRDVHRQLKSVKKHLSADDNILNPAAHSKQSQLLRVVLNDVESELTTAFLSITNAHHIKNIRVVLGESGPVSLDIVIELENGRCCFPQQIFSEGLRDLLAILFFLSFAMQTSKRGQAKVLILDDVFQSVDASVRVAVMNYVLKEFKKWQIIVTAHDRLWFEQLRSQFQRHGHQRLEVRLLTWSFDQGPHETPLDKDFIEQLRRALSTGDGATVCGVAGRVLEQLGYELGWRLRLSVTRNREDKYTLADTWAGLAKWLKGTELFSISDSIDMQYDLRNLVGAHFNEWASSLTWQEASMFGEAVRSLAEATFCSNCSGFIAPRHDNSTSCDCQRLTVKPKIV